MSGEYNPGSTPARVVLVDPVTLADYTGAGGGGATDVELTGSAAVDIAAVASGIGAPDDAPWDGEGNGSVIAILKGIFLQGESGG